MDQGIETRRQFLLELFFGGRFVGEGRGAGGWGREGSVGGVVEEVCGFDCHGSVVGFEDRGLIKFLRSA